MSQYKSNKGKIVDFQSLLAQYGDQPAVGNMNVNARGDLIGKGGQVIQKAEDRARAYYKDNPKSSTASKSSIKGPMPDEVKQPQSDMSPKVKTAEAMKTEQAQTTVPKQPVAEPDEFDAPDDMQPLGYKEVELPNGDIEMVPYYNEDDA